MGRIVKRALSALMLALCCAGLIGCGGQEIESCLFVISMAVDPAPDGNMTVTVKALSGSQESPAQTGAASGAPDQQTQEGSALEDSEPGYIVLSATAPSCLRALNLLASTTPRTLNLSQLREIVLSETLARSGAALSALREIHSLYRANSSAVVVVTPDDAGDFIRRQHALLGVRLSQYLDVLFEHYAQMDLIPPRAMLSAVIADMESSTADAAAVYAAGNAFDSTLVLPQSPETDRLPGHLPRTSPAQNEYLGSAVFSGAHMTGTLTGSETGLLCLMSGQARTRTAVFGGTQYRVDLPTRVRRSIDDGALCVDISMQLTRTAGASAHAAGGVASQTEMDCVQLLERLQAMGSDVLGFGGYAVRGYADIPSWEASGWAQAYAGAPVRVRVRVRIP